MIGHDGVLVLDNKAMGHVFAAYRRGHLTLTGVGENLSPEGFGLAFGKWLQELIHDGGQAVTINARVLKEEMPIGLVTIDYSGKFAYPDIHWFPEATPRNRVESALYLMLELKKDHMVFITVPGTTRDQGPDWKFLMHLAKYGVLRPVGTIRDHGGDGKHATLFQSVGS